MPVALRPEANARVVMVARRYCRVQLADGSIHEALARGKLYDGTESALVTGDEVDVELHRDQYAVERVLPRTNEYLRQGLRNERQVMFANVDRVLILASLHQPQTKVSSIDRFLVAALAANIPPILVLTKLDLDERRHRDVLREDYRSFDVEIFPISNVFGSGVSGLRKALREGVTALIGNSGVGKTSLLNNLMPGLNRKVSEVSSWSGKGVHTTTAATFVNWEKHAAFIDTPGMKSFVPYGIDDQTLLQLFPEIAENARDCRFSDCAHDSEPDCAVRAAFESERIPAARFVSYQRIRQGLLPT